MNLDRCLVAEIGCSCEEDARKAVRMQLIVYSTPVMSRRSSDRVNGDEYGIVCRYGIVGGVTIITSEELPKSGLYESLN